MNATTTKNTSQTPIKRIHYNIQTTSVRSSTVQTPTSTTKPKPTTKKKTIASNMKTTQTKIPIIINYAPITITTKPPTPTHTTSRNPTRKKTTQSHP